MIVLLIFLITRTSAFDDNICRNQTILQTPGDALLTVFVDATFGPNCNESSSKGFQELTTALYVITVLNREDYVSGITLGLKLIDTCQDPRSVYKQCLVLAADADCMNDYYNLGVLAPESYIPILQQLQDFTELPLAFYYNENITKPLVNIAIDFISKKYMTIDILLTDSDFAESNFLDGTRDSGICVKTINNLTKLEDNDNGVIVVAAGENLIRSWIDRYPGNTKTWIILPLDDSEPDDIVPIGSYIIRSQSLTLDLEDYLITDNNNVIAHSPHLLGIGRSLVSIAELLQDIQRTNCPGGVCSLPLFDTRLLKKITIDDVFDALKIQKKSRTIKYIISQRIHPNIDELEDIFFYEADVDNYQVLSNYNDSKLISCMSNNNCHECINVVKNLEITETPVEIVTTVEKRSTLKTDYWVPVVLVLVVSGSLICLGVGGYIIYKFFTEEVLDGNPTFTIILIIGNILLLYSTIAFCLDDDVFDDEHLNSRKIFLTTLANGIVFSVMLSRSFFLALSTGGVFTSHINGYLQGLMVFFMSGVQIGMSTIYFIVGPSNSRDTLRSPVIIGLLSYDMFLLLTLLGVSILINQIPRNYREGKCFFITAIALVITWLIWITIFLLINKNWRDVVITFGLITTAYVIIGGVLLPRVYYMITHLDPDKTCQGHVEGAELRFEPRRRSLRQSRKPFYDYVLPMEGVRNTSGLQRRNANFYGSSSPANRHQLPDCHATDTVNSKGSSYNNYGYHNDMQEAENHYVVPRVCVIDPAEQRKKRGSTKSSSSDPDYAQPNYSSNLSDNSFEDDIIETEIYVEGKRLSPSRRGPNESYPSRSSSPRLYQTEATINEEDEEADQEVMKITRF